MALAEPLKQTRRLQISGGSTFIISLPKVWVEEFELKAGDNITIMKNNNKSITFLADEELESTKSHQATAIIGTKDSEESIRRKIIAMYLAGYKSIKITSKGVRLRSEQTGVIRHLTRYTMIGTEIVESDAESIIIQILTRLPELSFDVALKRMHVMTINLHKEAINALQENNKEYAEEVVKLDDEIDRFSLYMLRNLTIAIENASVLQEMGLSKPSDCLIYRTIIARIERIADHAALIAKRVKFLNGKIEEKILKDISQLSEESIQIFEKSIDSLISCDYNAAEQVADLIPKIVKKQEDIMASLRDTSKNSLVIKFVLDDLRRTAEYSKDIAEVVMDKNIQSVISEGL